MPAAGVVEALDVPEDPEPGLLAGGEAFAAEEFFLERGEEALGEGVVPGVADRAHREVDPGLLGSEFEGAARPTHFRGVLTVVCKLLQLTRPDDAFFGEKDYQQLTLVRAMVADLDLGVNVVGVPTVREADGLARSSRNVYLTPEQRAQAVAIPRALAAGAAQHDPIDIEAAAEAELRGLDVDYAAVCNAELGPPEKGTGRLLIAVRMGTTRLLDNCAVEVH